MVTGVELLEAICGALAVIVMAVTPPVLTPLLLVLLEEALPANELAPLLPPQPARTSAAATVPRSQAYLRIVFTMSHTT
jgi:hypothetical protein